MDSIISLIGDFFCNTCLLNYFDIQLPKKNRKSGSKINTIKGTNIPVTIKVRIGIGKWFNSSPIK
ncbi:hypothetical protein [Flavobacterium sp.]|uniref:hypothetical protein n=1 Tax=Flavobacterium sp. TaxID=239 RepID=UPI002FD95E46